MSADLREAQLRAQELDRRLEESVSELVLPPSTELLRRLRKYLQNREDEGHPQKNIIKQIRIDETRSQINLGPSIDKGPTDDHFVFSSGARLSFGVSLKIEKKGAQLLAYRFDLRLPPGSALEFIRFDLNDERHPDPLHEPRCHTHAGAEDVRIPSLILSPMEILDRIFFAVEPSFRQ